MKKVLIVRFSAFGDLVLTTGPLRYLRKKKPDLQIDLLTSELGNELFLNSIEIDRTFIVPKGSGLLQLINIYRKLGKYDVVIDLQGNFKSHLLKLFLRASFFHIDKQSKQRRSFVKNRKFKKELTQHVVQKYFNVIKKAMNLDDANLEELKPQLFPQKLTFSKKDFDFSNSIVIHPYASQKNKEWPYFDELVDNLVKKNFNVVIVGSTDVEQIIKEQKQVLNLTNKTSLKEMASIMSHSKALISTDSGPMHMGIAVGIPTLALFGPTTKEFGFYPSFKKTHVLEDTNLECRPCHVHGGDICPETHHKCMKNLSVDNVMVQLKKLIEEN